MISLSGLNPAQRSAAETILGPVLILAGAGSGKTRTITYRIAHMLDNLGIHGSSILAVSFTNKASQEMKERIYKLVPHHKKSGLTLSTFHSLGIKILREDIKALGFNPRFTIYDSSDQMSLLREGLKNYRGGKNFDRSVIQSKISWLKNQGISPEQFTSSRFYNEGDEYDVATETIYRFYQEKLHFFNALDFDDILYLVVQLFDQFPDIATKYSKRFQYVMVDEYQDTNHLQFKLVQHLTTTHNNICVVGDDDQAIYAFRGADIANILDFEKRYSNAKIIKLEENYRSYQPILHLANLVIKQNEKRKDKTMRTSQVGGRKPELWSCADTDHEAQVVVEDILIHQKQSHALKEMCILYRSNTQLPPFEDQLRLAQVPYTIIGGQKFYEKKEIKDLIAYLMIILNHRDEISLRRIINVPNRGVGNVTLQKLLQKSSELRLSLFDTLEHSETTSLLKKDLDTFVGLIKKCRDIFSSQGLVKGIEYLVSELNYLDFVEKSYDSIKLAQLKKDDVKSFVLSAERFTNRFGKEATLENFVERLLLADSQDNKNESEDITKNEVTLMTLHSSKGLEFDTVYLVGIEEELLPHKKTLVENQDLSEERRLCYVGITRARKNLVMTHAKERKIYGKNQPRTASRFMIGVEEAYLYKDKTTFDHMTPEESAAYKEDFFSSLIKSLE